MLTEAGGDWSFESWASNLTAAGALLGTVLGATGFLDDVFSTFSTSALVGLSLLFGAIAILAPIAYAALRVESDEGQGDKIYGSYKGLLVAAILTVWATSGELLLIAVVLYSAGLSRWTGLGVALLFILAFVLLVSYVCRSIRILVEDTEPGLLQRIQVTVDQVEPAEARGLGAEVIAAAIRSHAFAPPRRSGVL